MNLIIKWRAVVGFSDTNFSIIAVDFLKSDKIYNIEGGYRYIIMIKR